MHRKFAIATGMALGTAGLIAAVTVPVQATTQPATPAPNVDTALLAQTADVTDGVISAMQRDFHLTETQARARIVFEAKASQDQVALRKVLGSHYGGSWIAGDKLVVAVTDADSAAKVRALGAEAATVARSEAQLDAVKGRLDAAAAEAPRGVPGWYVDPATNSVVVLARGTSSAAARAFVAAAGAGTAVRIEESTESPRTLIDVIGGNAYYIGSGSRCSVGFPVTIGFVTAGHCGRTGATTRQPAGTFRASAFPGDDMAVVQVAAGNRPVGAVNNYSGGYVRVSGSQAAGVGASVCRSGSTTGWHCGRIQALNSSVNYPQGSVYGLIRTSVCAEPGDSGGSLLAGSQAQGVTSGGSGNCRSGGTTYFQPVNEILQRYGVRLVTS